VSAGALHIVSTPIGNLGDITQRALEVLRTVTAVLAEDTRHTRHLMDRYAIGTPLVAYHEHNEARTTPALVQRLLAGEQLALVSDAGTPLLSDPGARLVRAAIDAGVAVVPVPGASALLSALVASGIDATRFTFMGFLARSGGERRSALDELAGLRHTAVLYEAPGRVAATLSDLAGRGAGDRQVAVAREMTKQFEEVRRGTVAELAAYYESHAPRGEVVIVLAGAEERIVEEAEVRERVRALRAQGMSARDAATSVAAELGVSRRLTYRMTQEEG
jgi:16S rRNA (cytidine1402-2'-O)-methyltransferase